MSKVQELRGLVNQRLTAAAEEIFELFERTIAEYEEQLRGTKEKQHKVLDPEVLSHRPDVQQLFVWREEQVPPEQQQQERSPSLDQEDAPEPAHLKEEQEELWSRQEGEQLQGLEEEEDISALIFPPVPVKSEDDDGEEPQSSQLHEDQPEENRLKTSQTAESETDDSHWELELMESESDLNPDESDGDMTNTSMRSFEGKEQLLEHNPGAAVFTPVPTKSDEEDGEKPQSSQLHEDQTEEDRDTGAGVEDCGGSEPDRNSNPDSQLQPGTHGETSHTDERNDLEATSEPQSGSKPLQNNKAPVSDKVRDTVKPSARSSRCSKSAGKKKQLPKASRLQRKEKPFSCSICGERFGYKKNMTAHMTRHTKSPCFSCSICKRDFLARLDLVRHTRIHTGEKPFSCSDCDKSFTQQSNLYRHQKIHTSEKPFNCSACEASFRQKAHLIRHSRIHTGEKPFSCSVCRKTFTEQGTLKRHLTVHTGQKLFCCSVCELTFSRHYSLIRHNCKGIPLS